MDLPKNKYYFSQDGVLYGMGKTAKVLTRYPPGRQARSYRVMEGTSRIDSYGFSQCKNLQEIHIPDSVTSISFEAFNRRDSLTELTLPPQLHDLDYYVFSDCVNLRTVHLPDSFTRMRQAFIDCPSLTTIRLPDQLSLYGFEDAFKRRGSLKNILVSENSKNFSSWDGVLYNK